MIPDSEETRESCLETDSSWDEFQDDDIEPEAKPGTTVEEESTNGTP